MTTRIRAGALAVTLLALAGCAKEAATAARQIDKSQGAACTEERAVIERAVEAYMLLNPDASVAEANLVSAGYLREQSTLLDVTPTGAVVAAPGSPC